jgi:hypothetical protein
LHEVDGESKNGPHPQYVGVDAGGIIDCYIPTPWPCPTDARATMCAGTEVISPS